MARDLLRIFLFYIAVLTGLVSLICLWVWLSFAFTILINGDIPSELSGICKYGISACLYIAHFNIMLGVLGWLAWLGLWFKCNCTWKTLPQWVKYGCLVGVIASLAISQGLGLAVVPITTAILLLFRCWLKPDELPAA